MLQILLNIHDTHGTFLEAHFSAFGVTTGTELGIDVVRINLRQEVIRVSFISSF